ncbi:hypothetical protein GGQ68_002499 [Sagittula marina]|uniref:Uncharacterized protein n=1 Tax=Sagittula marina TaxID=943940 RepID=A0A7W6GS77_9RHOB|nr:hypothetical protein [Sagittula marina]MBB3986161.1 hypothetical protein [Sagittula marina]
MAEKGVKAMDSAAQKAGETRVRQNLIDPLSRLGLLRPSGMKVDAFEAMQRELCQRLAYMPETHIEALRETVEDNPAGKSRDRWPAATWILDRAKEISPPSPSASPLMRALFGHAFGQQALEGGWAPELLDHVKKVRRFPTQDQCNYVQQKARDNVDRANRLKRRRDRGEALQEDDGDWLKRRETREQQCREIAEIGQGGDV